LGCGRAARSASGADDPHHGQNSASRPLTITEHHKSAEREIGSPRGFFDFSLLRRTSSQHPIKSQFLEQINSNKKILAMPGLP
jgi:hypothetical protein